MRKWINRSMRWYLAQRYKGIAKYMKHPHRFQRALLTQIIQATKHTEWGKQYQFHKIKSLSDFSQQLPITDYEQLKPYIQRMMMGEKDVLWSGQVKWFSKSSGTTSDKSKFIPVTNQNLKRCHIKGTWDTMSIIYHQLPYATQFEHKTLLMGGSWEHYKPYPKTRYGDVSAIMIHHMPAVAHPFFTPDFETALLPDFEYKIEKMAQIVSQEKDMVMIGGVPTWTVVLFRKILEVTGKKNILEVWPNLQVYTHGGVSFTPYREQFKEFLPSDEIKYFEIYNASEGFFGIQHHPDDDDMLLLLNNGIYYEFLPAGEWHKDHPQAIPLEEVELGINYALVITTNAGLWRYVPGDTVQFTSKYPYKIKITGRTNQFVNAFGEEVMVSNTDKALAETCQSLNSIVADYTVAPIYFNTTKKGGHQWLIEFEKTPANLALFNQLLDQNLQKINSDYEAKRYKDMALEQLKITVLPPKTFQKWLRSKGKYGGQHKVPRLSNSRKYVDDILGFSQRQRQQV